MEKQINQFTINTDLCTNCGICARTCPMGVLEMKDSPVLEKEGCLKCGQCAAVCPTGALSIPGKTPEESTPLKGNFPSVEEMKVLIRGRRSVRQYKDQNVHRDTIKELVDTAWHAPTGANAQSLLLTVMDDKASTDAFRKEVYRRLDDFVSSGKAADRPELGFIVWALEEWKNNGKDIVFRGAPHFIIASAPGDCPSPHEDAHIFLSYFELLAQSMGLGTCWNGMVKALISDVFTDLAGALNIPGDHTIGYAMVFGTPGVRYHRTVERGAARLNRAEWKAAR